MFKKPDNEDNQNLDITQEAINNQVFENFEKTDNESNHSLEIKQNTVNNDYLPKNRAPIYDITVENETAAPQNIWFNEFPPRIDESNYSNQHCKALQIWFKLLFFSFSGIMLLVLHTVVAIVSLKVSNDSTHGATIFMNVVCFLIPFFVMHYIKLKINGTCHDVSLTLLLRYYNFATTAMLGLWGFLLLWTNKQINFEKSMIIFCVFLSVVLILSIVLAAYPGTIRQRCMKFFFIWPMKTDDNEDQNADKLVHILWITRQLFQVVVIVVTMLASRQLAFEIRKKTSVHDLDESLRYNAKQAFFQAGFCEEYFKFFLAAGVSFIPKYNKSKSAILQVSIVVSVAFSVVEDILYATRSGWSAAIRPLMFPLHYVFNYPCAYMITRQRDSIWWVFELLGGFIFAVGLHGTYDYVLFLGMENKELAWLSSVGGFVFAPALVWVGLVILISPKSLPKEENSPTPNTQVPAIVNNIGREIEMSAREV